MILGRDDCGFDLGAVDAALKKIKGVCSAPLQSPKQCGRPTTIWDKLAHRFATLGDNQGFTAFGYFIYQLQTPNVEFFRFYEDHGDFLLCKLKMTIANPNTFQLNSVYFLRSNQGFKVWKLIESAIGD